MNLKPIKQAAGRLTLGQLRKLDEWLHELTRRVEESSLGKQSSSRKEIVEERIVKNKTYRLQSVRCGKEKCKCARGKPHGPYWYSYTRVHDKLISQYVGKRLPGEVERALNKGMKP